MDVFSLFVLSIYNNLTESKIRTFAFLQQLWYYFHFSLLQVLEVFLLFKVLKQDTKLIGTQIKISTWMLAVSTDHIPYFSLELSFPNNLPAGARFIFVSSFLSINISKLFGFQAYHAFSLRLWLGLQMNRLQSHIQTWCSGEFGSRFSFFKLHISYFKLIKCILNFLLRNFLRCL